MRSALPVGEETLPPADGAAQARQDLLHFNLRQWPPSQVSCRSAAAKSLGGLEPVERHPWQWRRLGVTPQNCGNHAAIEVLNRWINRPNHPQPGGILATNAPERTLVFCSSKDSTTKPTTVTSNCVMPSVQSQCRRKHQYTDQHQKTDTQAPQVYTSTPPRHPSVTPTAGPSVGPLLHRRLTRRPPGGGGKYLGNRQVSDSIT